MADNKSPNNAMQDQHKPREQILRELKEAGEKIEKGAQYAHYKHPEQPYTIYDFCVLEATDEICALYGPTDEPRIRFVRPVSVFLETVEWEGETLPRFRRVAS